MSRLLLLALTCVTLQGVMFSQATLSEPGALKICADVKDVALPPGDRPTPEEATALEGCASEDLYFGFEKQPDPVRARKCAYLEMDRGNNVPFAGRTILMMAYANGKGATRNFEVALKLACEVPGGPGDVAGRVHQLARLKQSNWTGDSFSVCDHSGDRYMYRQCAILDYRFDHLEREKTLEALAVKFSTSQKKAFAALRRSATAYFKVEAAKGIGLSSSYEVHEEGFLERGFISSLQQFENGKLPQSSAAEAAEAQATMKSAFDGAVAGQHRSANVTAEGLKETQQAWLRYRKAWMQFGKARYPAVSQPGWEAWLDQQRTELLGRAK